ncbi:MAG: ankyrin repeat domain-containing protein [Candidatus Amoebophilus sp.]
MKKNIHLNNWLITFIALISIYLQSCGGDYNPLILTREEQIASIQTNTQAILPLTNIQPLIGQKLAAQGGHAVTFYEEAGELRANVAMNAPKGFSKTYGGLSVIVEQGAELAKLSGLYTKAQEGRIHIQLAQGNQPAKVVIYKEAGLMGGMLEGEEVESEANANSLSLLDLPTEVLQNILVYVKPRDLSAFSLVARGTKSHITPDIIRIHLRNAIEKKDKKKNCIFNLFRLSPTLTNINNKYQDSNTPLHVAIKQKLVDVVDKLLDQGAEDSIKLQNSEGHTPLHLAIISNSLDMVSLLIRKGAINYINVKDNEGYTPLHLAIINGSIDMINLLLTRGGINAINKQDNEGRTPLHLAIKCTKRRSIGLVRLLLDKARLWSIDTTALIKIADSYERTSLHYAAKYCSQEMIELLLEFGAEEAVCIKDLYQSTPLHMAAQYNKAETVELLLENAEENLANQHDTHGNLPIFYAISNPDVSKSIEIIQQLGRGAKLHAINSKGDTPMHLAVKLNSNKILEVLLRHMDRIDFKDNEGNTLLHLAVLKKNYEIVNMLLKHSPYLINYKNNDGNTSVYFAISQEDEKILKLLLNNSAVNADLESRNRKGICPFHMAAAKNNIDIIKLLLECGANIDIKDRIGYTPVHIAACKGHTELVKFFISHGADIKIAATDEYKNAPIHTAVKHNHVKVVRLLLSQGANVNTKNAKGKTAIDLAQDNKEMLEILKNKTI